MWLQTTQLGNKPTQTGLALNSKPQLTWALAIVQRSNHASPGPSLYCSPRRGTLFFCTLHKPLTPLPLSLLSSDGMGLLPFSMTETTEIKIPHSTPTTSLRCPLHSTFSLVTQHRYVLALIYSQPVTSALFPISYSLLKKTRPVKSSHPLRHFSHSLPYCSQHVKEV